jgi:hypothetical protein
MPLLSQVSWAAHLGFVTACLPLGWIAAARLRTDAWSRWSALSVRQQRVAGVALAATVLAASDAPTLLFLALMATAALHLLRERNALQVGEQTSPYHPG